MRRVDGLEAKVGRARDLWASVGHGGVLVSGCMNVSSGQPCVESTRVETTRPRAQTSKSDIVRSYCTISGTAYGDGGKAAVGPAEARASGASGLCTVLHSRPERVKD